MFNVAIVPVEKESYNDNHEDGYEDCCEDSCEDSCENNYEANDKKNSFQVTWYDDAGNIISAFEQTPKITPEETLRLWRLDKFQLPIGQKLFRFLDGEAHILQEALTQAFRKGEIIRLHLNTCPGTHDWPFELLADKDFLLPGKIHLVRNVSRGSEKKTPSPKAPVKAPVYGLFSNGRQTGT